MARKLASVVRVSRLSAIENADRLVVAEMEGKGWKVVVQKGEFSEGDLAVYFEIDSFLDPSDSRYEFLRDRCLRKFVSRSGQVLREGIKIKTIKLRGVLSQGLLMPISKFGEITGNIVERQVDGVAREVLLGSGDQQDQELVGADVSLLLNVEHYDEVAEQLRPSTGGNPVSADAYGKFPTDFMPKTDEERIQNLGDWFESMKGRLWEITAKDDGSSMTVFYSPTVDPENPFGVCSRNLRLKEFKADGTMALMWMVARKYDLENKLRNLYETTGDELAFQMELVGPGVNSDRDKYQEHEAHVFRIWDVKGQKFVDPAERRGICSRLKIPHVQVIATEMPFFDKITTMDDALRFAEGKTARGNEREGVVLKTSDGLPFRSFKIVSNKYLLKQE